MAYKTISSGQRERACKPSRINMAVYNSDAEDGYEDSGSNYGR